MMIEFMPHNQLQKLREKYMEGTRIHLMHMEDIQAPEDGSYGTVSHVDDAGFIHVRWDNGSGLSLVEGLDSFEIVEEENQ